MIDIKEYLEENNLQVISVDSNSIVISYKFDLVEIDAAKSYLKELDCSDEEKKEEYNQYLSEIANDNIYDIMDEISEELDVDLSVEVIEQNEIEQVFLIKKNSNF